jgi:hypothetical protein
VCLRRNDDACGDHLLQHLRASFIGEHVAERVLKTVKWLPRYGGFICLVRWTWGYQSDVAKTCSEYIMFIRVSGAYSGLCSVVQLM